MISGIEKLSIRNFGCLRDVENLALAPLTAFVGPNDAGKTMLFRALAAVRQSLRAKQGYGAVFPTAEQFLSHTFRGGGGPFVFKLVGAVNRGAFDYDCEVGWADTNFCDVQREQLVVGDATLRRDGTHVVVSPEDAKEPHLNFGGRNVPFINIPGLENAAQARKLGGEPVTHPLAVEQATRVARLLASMKMYALRPEMLRAPSPIGVTTMQSSGLGLPTAYAQLLLRHRTLSTRIENALKDVMPHVGGVNIALTDLNGVENGAYRIEITSAQGEVVPAGMVSDGVLLYLGYLVLAMDHGPSRILLLEEPETGIHPGLLKGLVPLFRKMAKGEHGGPATQILMTTHSPLLVNWMKPEEIRLVQRDERDGATRITPFDNNPNIAELLEYQGPGEIWINQGEEYLSRSQPS